MSKGDSLQSSSELEILEVHCNTCNNICGYFFRNIVLFPEPHRMSVQCWKCRTRELSQSKTNMKKESEKDEI